MNHTDGNAAAGVLAEIFTVEPTRIVRRCQSCAQAGPLGEHRAYEGAGLVLRCAHCGDVALVIAEAHAGVTVEFRGAFTIALG